MRLRLPRFLPFALVGLTACAPGVACAADEITMDISPAFDGMSPRFGTVPVAVEFRNSGPDTPVTLRVDSDQFHMIYPLELPRGSTKRLLTYPNLGWGSARYTAQTNQGLLIKNYEAPPTLGDNNTQTILLIGDASGELTFIRGTKMVPNPGQNVEGSVLVGAPGGSSATVVAPGNQQSLVQDAYSTPSLAPDRAVGYANLGAVLLGSGAERLRDEQVDALKTYVLLGGSLVFVGGASAPLLNDPRWQDILPAHDFHVATLSDSAILSQLGGADVPRVSVMSGAPAPGATAKKDGSVLITAERGYGIGRVVYAAFNPFEAPLNRWDGRQVAMMKLIRPVEFLHSSTFLHGYSDIQPRTGHGSSWVTYSSGATTTTTTTTGGYVVPGAGYPGADPGTDPFSIQLPPAEIVFWLLAAYFVVVIPVNFLVLKKMKRGEAAWLTAPVISLGFAGAFFVKAHDLYSARMSCATQGIIVAQEGAKNAMFVGRTQMFIPQGGAYDLKLSGVDSLDVATSTNPYGYSNRDDEAELGALDTGEIRVPEMPANNLAFREITYRQYLPVGDWLSIEVTPDRKCTVRDTGPYALDAAEILVGNRSLSIGNLAPGASKTVSLSSAKVIKEGADTSGGFDQFVVRNRAVALVGSLEGLEPGPQIGTPVAERTSIKLALMAKEGAGTK